MDIIYKTGNFLSGNEPILLHGCNAQGVMGAGAAKQVRQKYPKAYHDYRRRFVSKGLSVGDNVYSIQPDDRIVVNAITQEYYGHSRALYVNYDAIRTSLARFDSFLEYINMKSASPAILLVAMPMIGTGYGRGDWRIVEKIINECSSQWQPVVYKL